MWGELERSIAYVSIISRAYVPNVQWSIIRDVLVIQIKSVYDSNQRTHLC